MFGIFLIINNKIMRHPKRKNEIYSVLELNFQLENSIICVPSFATIEQHKFYIVEMQIQFNDMN